jgi:hypothetical protein
MNGNPITISDSRSVSYSIPPGYTDFTDIDLGGPGYVYGAAFISNGPPQAGGGDAQGINVVTSMGGGGAAAAAFDGQVSFQFTVNALLESFSPDQPVGAPVLVQVSAFPGYGVYGDGTLNITSACKMLT